MTSVFTGSSRDDFEEGEGRRVRHVSEFIEKIEELAAFFENHAEAIRHECQEYLDQHRALLWFDTALSTLYHPTTTDLLQFAFFTKGEWNGYDLSYDTYVAHKQFIAARGKTKNPDYVPPPHTCCSNCICYYDDSPEYEWSAEDARDAKASNNIRINWEKRKAFEVEFANSATLDDLRPAWESWVPAYKLSESEEYRVGYSDHCRMFRTAVKSAAYWVGRNLWYIPRTLDFRRIHSWLPFLATFVEDYRNAAAAFRKKYGVVQEDEEEILAAAKQGIRIIPLTGCYVEE